MIKLNELNNWEDGINKVILADCYELMAKMEDKCVDLVVVDPPYEIHAQSGGGDYTINEIG